MINSITFQICALVYMLLLTVIYFSKARIDTLENKIYRYTIFVNLVALICDIASVITIYYASDSLVNLIFSKLYLVCIISWLAILTVYIFLISLKRDGNEGKQTNNDNDIKSISVISLVVFTILSIITFILPTSARSQVWTG